MSNETFDAELLKKPAVFPVIGNEQGGTAPLYILYFSSDGFQ